jgi:anthranilate synthase component 1
MTSYAEFSELCARGNVVPVFETFRADTETPVSVFLKLKDESPYSFLLESIEGGEKLARYSFLGFDPFLIFEITGRQFILKPRHEDVVVLPSLVTPSDHPLEALRKLFAHFRTVRVPGLPRFTGGAVGYFGYETVQLVENVPTPKNDELGIPDAVLMLCDSVLIFDNVLHSLFLVSNAYVPSGAGEEQKKKEYEKACAEIKRLVAVLETTKTSSPKVSVLNNSLEYTVTKDQYCRTVERVKDYIAAGDIFQGVISQRVKQKVDLPPFELYRALRLVNPSPYMYYLNFDGFSIVGSSPEMMVRVENGIVETRPIAGTRRRGLHPQEDARLEQELLHDEKERAEHLMLVDLARNDVGRISNFGSVTVTQFMAVEKYSHVMHLVSAVQGNLRKDVSPIEAMFSCFPAGTLTGAPKIRAMEIISELEPVKRNIYGGAVCYIDFSGNLDSCIAIRTIVAKDGTLYMQAGAGIVNDSKPEREYEETMEKLGANVKAVEMVMNT